LIAAGLWFVVAGAGAEDPETADLLFLSPWQREVSVAVRSGYKNNVLLSSFVPQGSAFLGGSADALATRPLGERTEFEAFGTYDYRYYLSTDAVHDEQLGFAYAQLRHHWTPDWQIAAAVEYLYVHQVTDVSATEANLDIVPVRAQSVIARPTLRRDLGAWRLELGLPAERAFYAAPLDDLWEFSPKLSLGRSYGNQSEVVLSYRYGYRAYDTEEERTADGTPIPGTQREMHGQEGELSWRHYWDPARHWRTTAKVWGGVNEDRGGGYFDYFRTGANLRALYDAAPWRFEVDPKVVHYDYPVQTVSATDPAKRKRTEVTVGVNARRQIASRFHVFLEYTYEQTLADRTSDDYSVQTISGGLNFEF
jgi:hypothetical protein